MPRAYTKAQLYARAGIQDYWIADLNQRRLIIRRDRSDGLYSSVVAYDADESAFPIAAPSSGSVSISELLP